MSSTFSTRITRKIAAATAIGAIGVAMFLGSGTASAQDNETPPPGEASCEVADGIFLPHLTVLKVGKDFYMCQNGQWVKKAGERTVQRAPSVQAGNLERFAR